MHELTWLEPAPGVCINQGTPSDVPCNHGMTVCMNSKEVALPCLLVVARMHACMQVEDMDFSLRQKDEASSMAKLAAVKSTLDTVLAFVL